MNSNNLQEAYLEVYQLDELTGGKGHPGYKSGSKDHGPMQSGHPADSEKRKDKGGTMSQRHGYHLGDIDDDDDDDEDDEYETIVKQQSRDSRERVRKPLRNKVRAARKVLSREQVDIYDTILSHLLDEGYASTEESADKIILNMSESWFEEILNERTRFAKETGKNVRTGRPSVEGGDPKVAERNKLPGYKYGGSKQEPKERGKKPPSPSEEAKKKGVLSPLEHKVALRRNARQRASDFRMDTRGT